MNFQASQAETPKVEQRAVQPETPRINDSVSFQPYEPKRKSQPYIYGPPQNCCDVAVYCYTKNIPVMHAAGCETQKV